MQGALFDAGEERPQKPQLKCPPWLAKRLAGISNGKVKESEALKWTHARAMGVLSRYQKTLDKAAQASIVKPVWREPHELQQVAVVDRLRLADELQRLIADAESGVVPTNELYRCLRGALYVFDRAELVRIAKGIANLAKTVEGEQ